MIHRDCVPPPPLTEPRSILQRFLIYYLGAQLYSVHVPVNRLHADRWLREEQMLIAYTARYERHNIDSTIRPPCRQSKLTMKQFEIIYVGKVIGCVEADNYIDAAYRAAAEHLSRRYAFRQTGKAGEPGGFIAFGNDHDEVFFSLREVTS